MPLFGTWSCQTAIAVGHPTVMATDTLSAVLALGSVGTSGLQLPAAASKYDVSMRSNGPVQPTMALPPSPTATDGWEPEEDVSSAAGAVHAPPAHRLA